MAEFFSRLIERSLGLKEVVQPVLPARFAPIAEQRSGEGTAEAPEEAQEIEAGPSTPVKQAVYTAIPETGPFPFPEEIRSEKKPFLNIDPAVMKTGHQENRENKLDDAGPDVPHPADQNPTRLKEKTKEFLTGKKIPISRDVAILEERVERPLVPAAFREAEMAGPLPESETRPLVESMNSGRAVRRDQGNDRLLDRPGTFQARRMSPAVPKRQTGGVPNSLPRESVNGEPGSEPPVIKVHIGRIEVRAVMPPAPPPKKDAGPRVPRLTLKEYLNQRERGRT